MPTTYLYRLLENDDDGVSRHFGIIVATDPDDASQHIAKELNAWEFDDGEYSVRLYPVTMPAACGSAEPAGAPVDVTVTLDIHESLDILQFDAEEIAAEETP